MSLLLKKNKQTQKQKKEFQEGDPGYWDYRKVKKYKDLGKDITFGLWREQFH